MRIITDYSLKTSKLAGLRGISTARLKQELIQMIHEMANQSGDEPDTGTAEELYSAGLQVAEKILPRGTAQSLRAGNGARVNAVTAGLLTQSIGRFAKSKMIGD